MLLRSFKKCQHKTIVLCDILVVKENHKNLETLLTSYVFPVFFFVYLAIAVIS